MRKNIFSMTPTRLSSLFRSFRVVSVPLVSFFTPELCTAAWT